MKTKEKRQPIDFVYRSPGNGNGDGYNGWGGISHRYSNYSLPVHPGRLGLWLFIAASIMLFAAFTSAYLVRQNSIDWIRITLPSILWVNSVIIVISSIAAHWGYLSVKKGDTFNLKLGLITAISFGVVFLAGQITAWNQLTAAGLVVNANPAASFFYVLSGVHAIHIIGGLGFLLFATLATYGGRYNRERYLGVELAVTFWHFLGVLWIYLYVFLLILQPD